jgi:hypothetical protein
MTERPPNKLGKTPTPAQRSGWLLEVCGCRAVQRLRPGMGSAVADGLSGGWRARPPWRGSCRSASACRCERSAALPV